MPQASSRLSKEDAATLSLLKQASEQYEEYLAVTRVAQLVSETTSGDPWVHRPETPLSLVFWTQHASVE